MTKQVGTMLAAALLALPANMLADAKPELTRLEREVRRELITLPFLTVYDNLSFKIDNGNVILMGSTIRPTIRTDAENVVKRLEGVAHVDNRIEVLPLSPFDDSLRLRVARAVYGFAPLNRYALGANPSIRIVVKNGNVTLEGVVASEADRNFAFLQANGVAGVFSVTNNLAVSRS